MAGEEERRAVAVQVALRTGLLRKCPDHGAVYDPGQHDYQGACMVASYLVTRGDPLVAPFGDALGEPAGTVPWIFAFCLLPFVPRAWRVARSLAAFSAFCSAVQCRRRVRSAQQREATALRFSSECSIPFGSVTTRSSAGVRLGAH